jgi:hypothetical protein
MLWALLKLCTRSGIIYYTGIWLGTVLRLVIQNIDEIIVRRMYVRIRLILFRKSANRLFHISGQVCPLRERQNIFSATSASNTNTCSTKGAVYAERA